MSTIYSDLAAAVGNTPLIRLNAASEATGCEILGKAEFMNPGQSVKDRAALYIINAAVASGDLRARVARSLKVRRAIRGLAWRWSAPPWAFAR